jgi:diguanylate cyclase (GGDEF)-like protein
MGTDRLTGLPDKEGLKYLLDANLASTQDVPLTCLLVDIDSFKNVSVVHDFIIGDELLRKLAALLEQIVQSNGTVGRWGGNRFLVVLPRTTVGEGKGTAERIAKQAEDETFDINAAAVHVTVSIGCAQSGGGAADRDTLLALAEEALLEAKRGGRNSVVTSADPRASRPPAPDVPPVEYKGVRYSQVMNGRSRGLDQSTGYLLATGPALERDAQEIYFRSMKLDPEANSLLIEAEFGGTYCISLKDRTVIRIE